METIPKEECVKIGFVKKPHGIHGELVISFREEFYETLEEFPTLLVEIDQLLVPYFISEDGLRFKSGESVIAKLDWIDTEEQVKSLCGLSVYVNQADVVENDDEFSPDALVGYRLYDETRGFIGLVEGVNDYSGNLLLLVEYQGREVMIPLNDDLITRFDGENREIELSLPEGLLDLNEE